MKGFLAVFFIVFISNFVISQAPKPCGAVAQMEPFCSQACIICDIDGFSGINNSPVSGSAPADFCTTQQNNIQWISFIAGSEDLKLEVTVGNCTGGVNSLEVGIYEGINCMDFKKVSNCDTDIPENSSQVFTTTEKLVVGQYYFFIMDGSGGTVCNYSIKVLEGSTKVSPLVQTGPILVPDYICVGTPFQLSATIQSGATLYDWTINGAVIGNKSKLDYTIDFPGTYDVCFTESNACDEAPITCTQITVQDLPEFEVEREFCEGDSVFFYGISYTSEGLFSNILVDGIIGCDTIYNLNIVKRLPAIEQVGVIICELDSFFLNGQPYTIEGIYEQNLLTTANCDSTILLDLQLIVCNIKGQTTSRNLDCFGDTDTGEFTFGVTAGTAPFTYTWNEVFDPSISGSGAIATTSEIIQVSGIPKGQYVIQIFDNFGNETVLQATVKEPEQLKSKIISTQDFNGYDISCADSSNGEIEIDITGGIESYDIRWSNNIDNQTKLTSLAAGIYSVTITDINGCEHTDEIVLNEPEVLEGIIEYIDPTCFGIETGVISVPFVLGGVSDYKFRLNNGQLTKDSLFVNLMEGNYELTIEDANGCTISYEIDLIAPGIPSVELPAELTIELGDSIQLIPEINQIFTTGWNWNPSLDLSCLDCLEPWASPLFTNNFTIVVTSDDGCERKANITIRVLKNRDVYAPNVINPSSGLFVNRFFTLFGSKQIEQINYLKIYDRWGNKVYENTSFPAGETAEAWDGFFNGKEVMEGLYGWVAEVQFLDKEIKVLKGDVSILR